MYDSPRSERPSDSDKDHFNDLINDGPYQSTQKLTSMIDCDQSIIEGRRRLHSIKFKNF